MEIFSKRDAAAAVIHNPDQSEQDYQFFLGEIEAEEAHPELISELTSRPAEAHHLKVIFGASPYLTSLVRRDPALFHLCLTGDPEVRLDHFIDELKKRMADEGERQGAMHALRRFKHQIALLIAFADISGAWNVAKTTEALSRAAETALTMAVRFLLREAHRKGEYDPLDPEEPEKESGYIVLGMGKFGAHELNYSSDIDLIIFYQRGQARLKEGLEPSTFFVRLTRALVTLMHERTEDGYVFRTDLRLRPDPGATQVALSTEAALVYYESSGQNWERSAYIKARPVAGDLTAGKAFLKELSPFIWRKYLDFAAIADIHAMKRQIHSHKGHGEVAISGHNIKLGRGGIREIEFFVQTQQLISGGRQPDLRLRGTLEGLSELAQKKWITAEVSESLRDSYFFLRHVEHRLQMVADEQTHNLPSDEEGLEKIAHFSGFPDFNSFSKTLSRHLEGVQGHYSALFEDFPSLASGSESLLFIGDEDDPATLISLKNMGYSNPSQVIAKVRAWHFARYPAMRSEKARERLTEVQPRLIEALAKTVHPDMAFFAFDRFLSDLPSGIQLFSLLRNNPNLLRLIANIMGTAPRLSNILSTHAHVLDAVLDPGFFGDLPSDTELKTLIDEEILAGSDYQDCLDRARRIGQEQSFLVGARLLTSTISPAQIGTAYSRLADRLINVLKQTVERELKETYGKIEGGAIAVLAMGKLGSMEMTANSDLDLITIYSFDPQEPQSDGSKSIYGSQYYSRVTQRFISALTAPTSLGTLYEVDMRLRPSGNAGPVATHIDSFIEYQQREAWTWEHMALTRARVVASPPGLQKKIEGTIHNLLCLERDPKKIARDVIEMRARIAETKTIAPLKVGWGSKELWSLKYVRGGLVDVEFICQYLQLIHAHHHNDILDPNSLAALRKLAKKGLLDEQAAETLIPAASLYHTLTQILRLCFESSDAPEGLQNLLIFAAQENDFQSLESRLIDTTKAVATLFDQIIAARL